MRALHTMARSVVVKGVESPERLLDETALFLHRVVADLPPGEAAHAAAAAQLRRGPDAAARCCWSTTTRATSSRSRSVLERRGMEVLTATTGSEAIAVLNSRADVAIVLMDIMMPGHGRLRDHPGDPRAARSSAACPSWR